MIHTRGNRWRSVNLHCSGIAQIGHQEHRIAFTHLDCPKDFYLEEAILSVAAYLHYTMSHLPDAPANHGPVGAPVPRPNPLCHPLRLRRTVPRR
jgi:hypothetical protein